MNEKTLPITQKAKYLFLCHVVQTKDTAPENPDTRAVSGFFRAPILGCKQKDVFLCPEDLNYRPPRFQAAFERCILPKAAFFRFH